jgi:hypothetical protein
MVLGVPAHLSGCLFPVVGGAEALPVVLVPEEGGISLVRDDVVELGGEASCPFALTLDTPWMMREIGGACLTPASPVVHSWRAGVVPSLVLSLGLRVAGAAGRACEYWASVFGTETKWGEWHRYYSDLIAPMA